MSSWGFDAIVFVLSGSQDLGLRKPPSMMTGKAGVAPGPMAVEADHRRSA